MTHKLYRKTLVNGCQGIICIKHELTDLLHCTVTKQLLDEVEHDIMNYQNRGLCYVIKPTRGFDNS